LGNAARAAHMPKAGPRPVIAGQARHLLATTPSQAPARFADRSHWRLATIFAKL